MKNKIGILIGILSGLVYGIAKDKFDYHSYDFITASLLTVGALIGNLIIPALLAYTAYYHSEKKSFGELFAGCCIILHYLLY